MIAICLLALLHSAVGTFVTTQLNAETQCRTELTVIAPPEMQRMQISHIAWPIQGPAFQTIPVINSAGASGPPETICMNGCSEPPCLPITACDANSLWWRVPYNGLIVDTPRLTFTPDQPYPPVIGLFYSPALPTVSPVASPSSTAATTPTASSSSSSLPSSLPSPSPVSDKSSITGLSVAFAFLLLGFIAVSFAAWRTKNRTLCPFCETQLLLLSGLRDHLRTCKSHLEVYSPVSVDRVTVVNEVVLEEKEDEVATPESAPLRT